MCRRSRGRAREEIALSHNKEYQARVFFVPSKSAVFLGSSVFMLTATQQGELIVLPDHLARERGLAVPSPRTPLLLSTLGLDVWPFEPQGPM